MKLETLSISVEPSPPTRDHQVLLRSEHGDLIHRFDEMMGLDPNDILVRPCPLLPGPAPHAAIIGRCDCGIAGCGSVEVVVSREGQVISWVSNAVSIFFDASQYLAEVERALSDLSWETHERTAARLISSSIDRAILMQNDLKFTWASGRHSNDKMVISLEWGNQAYQILVFFPLLDESPEALAQRCCQLLRQPPEDWPAVFWLSHKMGLDEPFIAGPGWRPYPR